MTPYSSTELQIGPIQSKFALGAGIGAGECLDRISLDPARFELTTSAFGGRRSIRVSCGSAMAGQQGRRSVGQRSGLFSRSHTLSCATLLTAVRSKVSGALIRPCSAQGRFGRDLCQRRSDPAAGGRYHVATAGAVGAGVPRARRSLAAALWQVYRDRRRPNRQNARKGWMAKCHSPESHRGHSRRRSRPRARQMARPSAFNDASSVGFSKTGPSMPNRSKGNVSSPGSKYWRD
jgi:hypothetical protein